MKILTITDTNGILTVERDIAKEPPDSASTESELEPAEVRIVPAGGDESESVLAKLEKVRGLLAEVRTVPQAKEVIAAARAVEIYARETRASADILTRAFRIRSLAKRRLGEVVVREKAAGRLKEGRPGKTVVADDRFSLADLGISKDESARAQEFASVSGEAFERALDESGSGDLSERGLLRRIRAAKAKTVPSSNSKTPSTATVPGQSAGAVPLKTHVTRVADALDKLLAGWKLTDLAPLKEAARGNERLAGGLERLERNLDRAVKTLRGYRSIAS